MESIPTRNAEFEEDEQQHKRLTKPCRSVCGNRIYLSHSERNSSCQKRPLFYNTIKSVDVETRTNHKDQNYDVNNVGVANSNTDSCTQTSKTILQLAKSEIGCLTPDSLMQSPRNPKNPDWLNRWNHLNLQQLDSKLQSCTTGLETSLSCCTLDGSVCEQETAVSYLRKNNLREYLDSCEASSNIPSKEEITVYPKQSLTKAFLLKKQNDGKVASNNCRSQFLQQTSPLRNLNIESPKSNREHFKSQSCIEQCDDSLHLPNYSKQERVPCQISRFTVKGIKDQQFIDNTQPLKCHWNPADSKSVDIKYGKKDQFSSNREQYSPNGCNIQTSSRSPPFSPRKKYHSSNQSTSFMSPTLSSEQRNQSYIVQELRTLISPTRRGKSMSPTRNSPPPNCTENYTPKKIPYIDQSKSQMAVIHSQSPKVIHMRNNLSYRQGPRKSLGTPLDTRPRFDEDLLKLDLQNLNIKMSEGVISERTGISRSSSVTSCEAALVLTLNRIRDPDWNVALKGIAEMTELCRTMDADMIYPHMTTVNQRLLELLRSPRSHVCRTACQAAGHFFESMKDTRRPEFDDIVENLLYKTADANKFIRKDANLSLDCMVTHIPICHSVRSLCLKGPLHKNALVRTATIRLIICAVVIAGPDVVLNHPNHEYSRKRIIQHLAKFLTDKNLETRKYGERLYKILCKESIFESCLKKYLEKNDVNDMKASLKCKR